MADKIVFGMNCPSCGGRVEVQEGDQLVLCKFCNSVHALKTKEGISKLMYRMAIDRDKAVAAVTAWFKKGFKARDLPQKGVISEVSSIYLPYWRMIGRGKGIVCGYTEEQDKDGNTSTSYYNNVVDNDYLYSRIACDAGDIGVTSIKNVKGEILPFQDEDEIPIFEATESKSDARDAGEKRIFDQAHADGRRGMQKVTFSKLFVDTKGFELVFYPFQVVRYDYMEKGYFAVVDGVTGDVLSGRAPGDAFYQSISIGVGGAVAGGLTGGGIGYSIITESGLFVATTIIGLSVLWYAYNTFRYRSEVIVGDLPKPSFNPMSMFKKTADVPVFEPQGSVEIVARS
ncbi:hypothetical protein J2T58_001697 [Methanocalculus alkaliphilus]|uniref:hypothetical protein n=1 Tax=Methanocalculus alkaliphilus TaxID=768730 RepID=UPI00209FB1EA|nr:hypothetical protein [Methanocalculus alkaliphilus]MCP1715826.1 hypothetical protein [Methanocalculus alkaliphilus]